MVVATHRNSILLQLTAHDNNRSDFFVYSIQSVEHEQLPSLQRLPRCDQLLRFPDRNPQSRGLDFMFRLSTIGILSPSDREGFVVADLMIIPKEYNIASRNADEADTLVEAGLCLFRSTRPEDDWKVTRPRIHHEKGQGEDFAFWQTDVVVPFRDSLCYVDYFRGIMFVDVLTECPQIRYARLPVKTRIGDREDRHTSTPFCPWFSRSVGVTDGSIKFVEVVTSTVFVSLSTEPVSSSFTINLWKLSQDSMTWEKESAMDDTELWSLQGYGDLPRVDPKFPLVSMEEPGAVCLVLRKDRSRRDEEIWVIVVDMLNKTLRSSGRYKHVVHSRNCRESDGNMASASIGSNRAFMACEFSKYLHVPENTR
jgi:hypothetical protein